MNLKGLKESSKINIEKIEEFVPGKLYYKNNTESTNLDAKLTENVPDKSVFLADRQTKGRGRMGREWSSPSGVGIWMSIYLKPQTDMADISKLTLIAGLAVSRTINGTTIKWPNDVLMVTHQGELWRLRAGKAFLYPTHQEIQAQKAGESNDSVGIRRAGKQAQQDSTGDAGET